MTQFDPYRKWLGIPPEEQPPNLYRLLGIGLFESDPDVISNAADRQMVHVRSYQAGKYSEISQRILNELSAARVCLLDPVKKSVYDVQLRQQLTGSGPAMPTEAAANLPPAPVPPPPPLPPPAPPPEPPPLVEPPVVDMPGFVAVDVLSQVVEVKPLRRKSRPKKKAFPVGLLAMAIALVIAAIGGLLLMMTQSDGDSFFGFKKSGGGASQASPSSEGQAGQGKGAHGKDRSSGASKDSSGTKGSSSGQTNKPRTPLPDRVGEPTTEKVGGTPAVKETPGAEAVSKKPAAEPLVEPDADAQAKAEKQILGDSFQSLYEAASKAGAKPEVKKSFADTLMREGTKGGADPTAAFVLLRLSRDMAADAGEAEAALGVVSELQKRYKIDALAWKTATFERLATSVMPAAKRKLLAEQILLAANETAAAGKADAALALAKLARDQAQKSSEKNVLKQAAVLEKELERGRQKKIVSLQDAEEALAKSPDDPVANLMVGKHECFVKGDWKKGIACLALSSDTVLKALAQRELAAPSTADAQYSLGDAWWDAGEKQPKDQRDAFRSRAAFWYQASEATAKSLERPPAEQRPKGTGGS